MQSSYLYLIRKGLERIAYTSRQSLSRSPYKTYRKRSERKGKAVVPTDNHVSSVRNNNSDQPQMQMVHFRYQPLLRNRSTVQIPSRASHNTKRPNKQKPFYDFGNQANSIILYNFLQVSFPESSSFCTKSYGWSYTCGLKAHIKLIATFDLCRIALRILPITIALNPCNFRQNVEFSQQSRICFPNVPPVIRNI